MKTFAVWVLLLAVVPGASHAEDQTRQKILQAIEEIERRNINIPPELRARVKQYLDSNRKGRATKDQTQAVAEIGEYLDASNRGMEKAEQGDVIAQWLLAERYSTGLGQPQNYTEALKWYRKAAEQGNAAAQYNLGIMYHQGEGVPQNYAEALKWYHKAAEQGDAAAQAKLGFMYYKGQGIPKNDIKAYAWFSVAAAQRTESSEGKISAKAAKARDEVTEEMTPEAIAKGQALAAEYWEKYVVRAEN